MSHDLKLATLRPGRPGIRKVLGDLETDVMEAVWAKPAGEGTTVREVFETLVARRRIACTSVMNTMGRLAGKNVLRAVKAEPAYIYFPTVTQSEFVSRFVGRVLPLLLLAACPLSMAGMLVAMGRMRGGERSSSQGMGAPPDDAPSPSLPAIGVAPCCGAPLPVRRQQPRTAQSPALKAQLVVLAEQQEALARQIASLEAAQPARSVEDAAHAEV